MTSCCGELFMNMSQPQIVASVVFSLINQIPVTVKETVAYPAVELNK